MVLVGTMLLLGQHWPIMGVVMAIGAAAYVTLTVTLATGFIAPASHYRTRKTLASAVCWLIRWARMPS